MKVSQLGSEGINYPPNKRIFRPQTATLVMLAIIVLAGIICIGWFAGDGDIRQIVAELDALQEYPPLWLQVPMVTGEYLLAPTVILFLLAFVITRVSPQPRTWSRTIVVSILLALTLRYLLWRSLTTLNLSTPLNGVISLGLFGLEMLTLTTGVIQLFLMLRIKDRHREADQQAIAVLAGHYTPTVDILIPTYNEPIFILRRTVIGCQALDYPAQQLKIYLLDDTRRSEVEELAAELGCEYMTRPDSRHAKAGNLNHAIARTTAELIVIFDADFIPTQNFLTRTVGFFQHQEVALVQTPQSFYNPDPIARNLGLENILTPDEEVFYRQTQRVRDAAGSVTCAGTSFLVRRSALEGVGGFVTDSISEDYFTGICLSAQGHRLVYLNEKLSAGLAAENMAAYAVQRLRWARGTLQAFFIEANPLTIPGLSFVQRLAHLEGLMSWFTAFSRIGFLLTPLLYSLLGVIPVRATPAEALVFWLPYYVVHLTVFAWLNRYSRSALLSDIYSLVLAFPLALTVIRVMFNPFSQRFQVTPKGVSQQQFYFNWPLALPLMTLFLLTALSLWRNLGMSMIKGSWARTVPPEVADSIRGLNIGWIWSSYNLIMIGIALLILMDVPKPDLYDWFDLRRTVRLTVFPGDGEPATFWGVTTMLSEGGAEVALTQAGLVELSPKESWPVAIEIMEANLKLEGQLVRIGIKDEFPTVRIRFDSVNLEQHRCLVQMLFCRPGQWQHRRTPGELQSLLLLFRILLRPRVLFERDAEVRAIAVAKV
ncbi:MAG: cellulose synthase catalytic subunit [Aphanocapsa sp. GSE-SYN-MK-11-07L]|jgi:cellulose synthase (UDP-forming)|nr:cellulose synthase catalytic subunit [Aphanocapsa sp. GSE-SYN-MK-11-07L]